MKRLLLPCCLLLAEIFSVSAQNASTIIVNGANTISSVQPTMWGVFFEDINLGADGGIYAELIKNRSFEFGKPLMGWKILGSENKEGSITIQNRSEQNAANPRYLHIQSSIGAKGKLGINNEGFRGMGIKKGLRYDFSVWYRQPKKGTTLHIEILDEQGATIGSGNFVPVETSEWKKGKTSIVANAGAAKGSINIWFEMEGSIDLDMVSLFPADTWKGREGGLRADMVQMLADMKPGFIRFPGGCIVEGYDLGLRYQWKKTVGPVEQRQILINRWNSEFAHRPAPDYYQTFGLGFYEYFLLAEDIGAAPLPILNCGMACQFNTGELASLDQIEPYIQDALDLIEFANGDVTTKWGKLRNDMGHPTSFNLQFIGVGNENWGPQYIERVKLFKAAIKSKYPAIRIVNSSGTDPDGERFSFLNTELRKMDADIIDEHYYRKPEWFLQNAGRYDNYDRNSAKIFAGEYAAQSDKTVSVDNKNNWLTAMSEAAFLTGLERNAAVVHMASYAPLFAHIDGWQWTPDLIWVDNLRVYGTPNYYVQKLFSTNKGTRVVGIGNGKTTLTGQEGVYASAVIDDQTKQLIIKIVNASAETRNRNILLEGIKRDGNNISITVLKNELDAVNTLDQPTTIAPVEITEPAKGKNIKLALAPYAFTVIKVPLRK